MLFRSQLLKKTFKTLLKSVKKIWKKVHAYVSHNMCTTQSFVKSLFFSLPAQKREICVIYIGHTYDRFLSFSHKSNKKSFLRKTFDSHIETTKCTHTHFFRIFEHCENAFPNRVQMHPCSPLHFPLLTPNIGKQITTNVERSNHKYPS